MAKDIIAAALGFLTIPTFGAIVFAAVTAGKFITSFDLSVTHYWGGFWSLVGIVVVIGVCVGLYVFVTEFRNF